jgi:hypothetical protein
MALPRPSRSRSTCPGHRTVPQSGETSDSSREEPTLPVTETDEYVRRDSKENAVFFLRASRGDSAPTNRTAIAGRDRDPERT